MNQKQKPLHINTKVNVNQYQVVRHVIKNRKNVIPDPIKVYRVNCSAVITAKNQ